ncbi:unnamed protein product [Pieris macdunnoughi]|uniref:Reverse transcriptase domain-containing protein n=1 Tax=Pieris macdunnoughi TaxID=345717 RepID=A0A821QY81_9NEOP|nr:unnamed protein product [Pieris macdunnoughi]
MPYAILAYNSSIHSFTKCPQTSSKLIQPMFSEELIQEVNERNKRKKNIIMAGLPEQNTNNLRENMLKDETDIFNIFRALTEDVPKPIKIIRLGKYNPTKIRRVKVFYNSSDTVKFLLQNKSKLPSTIQIFSDQTPAQQKFLKNLKEELLRRQKAIANVNTYQVLDSYNDIKKTNSRLSFFYLNARSICKQGKFDELQCVLKSFSTIIHIILLTETWIKNEKQACELKLPNYTHYYNYRTDTIGGGVSIYVHNSLEHNLSESIYQDGNNYLWVQLKRYKIEVGVIYYPGNTNYNQFLEAYTQQLRRRRRAIVFGDFNTDLLTKNTKSKQYIELMNEIGYTILNKISKKYSTRDSTTRKSILDHATTNLIKDHFHMALIESSMSDHKHIYVELKTGKILKKEIIEYQAIDYEKLGKLTTTLGLDEDNDDYKILENSIIDHVNNCKIIKKKILNEPQKDWINNELISEINQRNKLWIKLKNMRDCETTKQEFEDYKNYVSKRIRDTKDAYYFQKFIKLKNNPKKMWNLVNDLAKNKTNTSCGPSKIIINSIEITNKNNICEEFNRYFTGIGKILADEIPKTYHDNFSKALPSTKQSTNLMILEPCSSDEILKVINNLDTHCSAGLDGISTKSIKCIKDHIAKNLSKCFNKLLEIGEFPDSLKIAKVTPIFKSGSKTNTGNYRPISVLPIISKILEKILYNRLTKYLTSINFLFERQYGFRPKSNTLTATIDLITKIRTNIDNKNITLGVFIDLKKAFDTVSHKLLLQKLECIGIKGTALKIFQSYLKNRFQVVKIDNTQSKPLPIEYGVPQGSILGPLLFLIYINNLHEIGLNGHLTLYADDTCLFYFGSSIKDIFSRAQEDLNLLFTWFQYNLLTVNASKSCYIIFKSKNKKVLPHDPLKINNTVIEEKNTEKYLGLRMDSGLTWNTQIEHIRSKLCSLMGSLRHIARCIPRQVRYTIYNSLVKPHLLYLIEVWGSAAKTKLINIQCRPLDLITGHFDPRDPIDIDISEHLLQQYSQDHKKRMNQVYDLINETSLHDRTQLTENRNKDREPEKEYCPDEQVFIRNPLASRQKLAPRFTQDTVLADLPIHIYTKKKRNPIAKSRLKRSPKDPTLLQDSNFVDHPST